MNIYLIENNEELCQQMKAHALGQGISFDFSTNLEDGISYIKVNNNSIDLIVLDGKGYLSPTETEEKALHALRGINTIKEINPNIIIVIYSAYVDEIEEQLIGNIDVTIPRFDKDVGIKDFFAKLKDLISNKEEFRVRSKYRDIFSIYEDGFLEKDQTYSLLIDLLKQYEFGDISKVGPMAKQGLVNSIRKIQESIIIRVAEYYDHIFHEDEKYVAQRIKALGGRITKNEDGKWINTTKVYMPEHIYQLANLIQRNTSTFIHYLEGQDNKIVTENNIKILILSIFEILIWFKSNIENSNFDR